MKIKFQTEAFVFFAVLLASTAGAPNFSLAATAPLTQCHIEVDNPHYSTFLLNANGIRAIKVNARSRCNQAMSQLRLTVIIYKVGIVFDHEAAKKTVNPNGSIYPNEIVKNEKTFVKCSNLKESKYFGVAFATAIIKGRHMKTLRVLTEKTLSFKCGY